MLKSLSLLNIYLFTILFIAISIFTGKSFILYQIYEVMIKIFVTNLFIQRLFISLYKYKKNMQTSHHPYCTIFLFINSGSGGGVGQKLVSNEVETMSFTLKIKQITGNNQDIINVEFYNMRKNKDKGFLKLKNLTKDNKKVIAVICGGDGTVMWVVSQLVKFQIELNLVPLAVIPLGTGNDFSRCLGWGKEQTFLTQNSFQPLKSLIKDWLKADVEDMDIWHVEAKVADYGYFQKVQDQKDKRMTEKVISKNFCNYFSFGIDGKVGYEFDKYRTKSRLGNLAVYGAMGIASNFSKIKPIGQLLDTVVQICDNDKVQVIFHGQKVKSIQQLVGNNIFDMKIDWTQIVDNVKNTFSLNNYQNVVALNINSYMGGVKDIWKKASEVELMKRNHSQLSEASHSDGKIQLVSFASTATIGLEKATHAFSEIGFSQKFFQGKGPFLFHFRKQDQKRDNTTYIQIDGQFIKTQHLQIIKLSRSTQIPNGKIKVLKKN